MDRRWSTDLSMTVSIFIVNGAEYRSFATSLIVHYPAETIDDFSRSFFNWVFYLKFKVKV